MLKDQQKNLRTHQIINPSSKLIGDKFSFFADCLDFMIEYAGEFYTTELETHYSIVKFLIFSVEHRELDIKNGRIPATISDVKYMLSSHPMLQKGDDFIDNYYKEAPVKISQILEGKYNEEEGLKKLKEELYELEKYLSKDYAKYISKSLSRLIGCEHTLNFHRKELEYLAHMVFAFFHLKGYRKKEISRLIEKLLQNEITIDEDRIYVSSPLPKTLYKRLVKHNRKKLPFDEGLHNDISTYFNNRTLQEQIDGIMNLSEYQENTYGFIFKIDNVILNEEEFTLNNIRYISIKKFKDDNIEQIQYFKEFFEPNPFPGCFAHIEVSAYSQKEALTKAIGIQTIEINKLIQLFKKDMYINLSGYIPYTYGQRDYFWVNSFSERAIIYKDSIENIKKLYTKYEESGYNTFIQEINQIVADAYGEKNVHQSIEKYWKFYDRIQSFCSINFKLNNTLTNSIRKMAILASIAEKKDFQNKIKGRTFNLILNSRHQSAVNIGLTEDRIVELSKLNYYPSMEFLQNEICHPHINFTLTKAINFNKKYQTESIEKFYQRVLLQLTSYRNASHHSNFHNEIIAKKIRLSIDSITIKIRDLLFNELRKNGGNYSSVNEMIDKLVNTYIDCEEVTF